MKYFFIFACLFLISCRQASKESHDSEDIIRDPSVIKINIDNIEENEVLKFSEIYDSIRFVKLETLENSIVGQIDKIIVTNDKYIILDISKSSMVFAFDKNGKFLNRIGKNGQGPGEYDFPDDIAYDKFRDELLIWSRNRKEILKFKLDGTYLNSIKLDWWISSIFVMDKNSYLLYFNNICQKNGSPYNYNIATIDNNGKVIRNILPYNGKMGKISPPGITVFNDFQGNVLFSPSYNNKIYEIDKETIRVKYFMNYNEHNIPTALLSNTLKNISKEIRNNGEYIFNVSTMETSSHLVSKLVYKQKIFDCYYSKKSEVCKISALYLNDMNALSPAGTVRCIDDDLVVSTVDANSFVMMKSILKRGEKDINKLLLSQLMSMGESVFNSNLKNNYSKAIKSTKITLSEEEINFINSIDDSDNPIIRIAKLKRF